ncbi:MAG: hypothetical protein JST11_31905 [Acidobacteria bacterium]|nr:hypothetical protein [Acidobacteriota bacterium]
MAHAALPISLRHRLGNAHTVFQERVLSFSRSIVFESPCREADTAEAASLVAFRFGSAADLSALREHEHDYSPAAKRFGFERLDEGDSIVVGESAGAILFYAWLMYRQIELDEGVCVPVAPGMVYSYKVFTAANARGRGICGAYYRFIRPLLAREGFSRLSCRVLAQNKASLHAHCRAGFVARGTFCRLLAAGSVLYRADARLCPWLHETGLSGRFAEGRWVRRQDLLSPQEVSLT